MPHSPSTLDIIYQDQSLLVVNKPAGLVTEPALTHQNITLVDMLKSSFNIPLDRSGIVHRLDKDTSGLLLVAKTAKSLSALQQQFKNRLVEKEYTCLSHGFLNDETMVNEPITRSHYDREKFTTDLSGKPSITQFIPKTHYTLSEDSLLSIFADFNKIQLRRLSNMRYFEFSLVKALPKTGRTHQIRVHLKHIGHPIVSDEKYAGRKVSRLDKRWCPRLFLHASKITFHHPTTKKIMIFEAPLPDDLEAALSFLELKKA